MNDTAELLHDRAPDTCPDCGHDPESGEPWESDLWPVKPGDHSPALSCPRCGTRVAEMKTGDEPQRCPACRSYSGTYEEPGLLRCKADCRVRTFEEGEHNDE